MRILQVKDLHKSFDGEVVLEDVSLEVNKGEVVAIIGPSGSGKSTLLRCINLLERIDWGFISVKDEIMVESNEKGRAHYAPEEKLRAIRLRLGMVFQSFNLFPHFSVFQNITEAPIRVAGLSKEEARELALELLEKIGLSDKAKAYPYQLSGGQSQRVAIARALAMKPEILCFDEPTSALDPELTGEVLRVMRALATEDYTMIVVTHEMSFAREVADRIIFMDKGQIITTGVPEELFQNSDNQRLKSFLSAFSGYSPVN